MVWQREDEQSQVVVVGPYPLFVSSFKTLRSSKWLVDEVIDAYLHVLIKSQQESVRQICAVVASTLFDGQIHRFGKNIYPEDIWVCPINVGQHWILVIFSMPQQAMFVIDPMGAEIAYAATLHHNWGLFLRMATRKDQLVQWKIFVLNHSKQQDSSSCGVLVLMFAKEYLQSRTIFNVKTSPEAILDARLQIACTLLDYKDHHN
ncbi:sentrin-specific protease 3-like [Lithobates pipiens]